MYVWKLCMCGNFHTMNIYVPASVGALTFDTQLHCPHAHIQVEKLHE